MKKILTLLLLTVLLTFCLTSCRQASSVIQNPNQVLATSLTPTYAARFDYFWRALNSHYVFWDIDSTDWDAVYNTYLPKFEELDKTVNAASEDKKAEVISAAFDTAVQYYTDLTKTLVDHHMAIRIFDPYTGKKYNDQFIVPADYEIKNRDYFHDQIIKDAEGHYTWSEGTELVNYFAEGGIGSVADGYKTATNLMSDEETAVRYCTKYDPSTGEGKAATDNVVAEYCIAYDLTIDKKNSSGSDMHVIYLAMSGYYLSSHWGPTFAKSPAECPTGTKEAFNWKAGKTCEIFFETVSKYFKEGSLAGIIMDNRNNGGGANNDLFYFLGLYSDKPLTVAYSKYKEGFGKTDYSSEVPYSVDIQTSNPCYCDLVTANIPYVVLCDLNSVSNGEVVTAGITSMSNGYSIGERTWGGTGPLLGEPRYLPVTYGGTFGNEEDGPVYVYTSTYNDRTFTRDGYKSLEGIGMTPDKQIYFKSTGKDNLVKDVQTMLKAQVKEAFSYIAQY